LKAERLLDRVCAGSKLLAILCLVSLYIRSKLYHQVGLPQNTENHTLFVANGEILRPRGYHLGHDLSEWSLVIA